MVARPEIESGSLSAADFLTTSFFNANIGTSRAYLKIFLLTGYDGAQEIHFYSWSGLCLYLTMRFALIYSIPRKNSIDYL